MGSLYPQLQLAVPPNRQPAAQPGDVLTLMGSYLSAITAVQVSHPLAAQPLALAPLSGTASQLTVQLPDPPQLPAGVATVAATFARRWIRPRGRTGDGHRATPFRWRSRRGSSATPR